MNVKKTPLEQVKDEHGGKAKLVDKVLGLIDAGDEDKDSLKARLTKASNRKLVRLLAISSSIKEKYGSPEKMAALVADKMGRAKDSDFVRKLGEYTPGKLLDMARSLAGERRRPLKVPALAAVAKVAKAKKVTAKVVAKPGTKKKKVSPARAKAANAKKAAAKKSAKS